MQGIEGMLQAYAADWKGAWGFCLGRKITSPVVDVSLMQPAWWKILWQCQVEINIQDHDKVCPQVHMDTLRKTMIDWLVSFSPFKKIQSHYLIMLWHGLSGVQTSLFHFISAKEVVFGSASVCVYCQFCMNWRKSAHFLSFSGPNRDGRTSLLYTYVLLTSV